MPVAHAMQARLLAGAHQLGSRPVPLLSLNVLNLESHLAFKWTRFSSGLNQLRVELERVHICRTRALSFSIGSGSGFANLGFRGKIHLPSA